MVVLLTLIFLIVYIIYCIYNYKRPLKIMFTGKMHSGKTTAANFIRLLSKMQSKSYVNIKFAQGVYSIMEYLKGEKTIDDCVDEFIYPKQSCNTQFKIYNGLIELKNQNLLTESDKKPRKLLQYIGHDFFRKIYSRFWIDRFFHKAAASSYNDVITCDDLRYVNESLFAHDEKWFTIKIISNEDRRIDRLKQNNIYVEDALSHPSEHDAMWLTTHFKIYNNDSKELFVSKIYKIYNKLCILKLFGLDRIYLKKLWKNTKEI